MLNQEIIQIEIAKGKKFETHNIFVKILRLILVPIINNLPNSLLRKIANSSSHDANTILNTVGSTHALEVMYTRYQRRLLARGLFQGIADFFWHHIISQLKAVRNRLEIVEESLEAELTKKISNGEKEIKILTVGGGSCRAIIHTASRLLQKYSGVKIEITNIDKDPKVIKLGQQIAETFNVAESFNWINGNASKISELVPENSVDIVEMVGLMDYFNQDKAVNILGQIHNTLKDGGFLIIANIQPNSEMKFVKNVGWLDMYYRTREDFSKIIHGAGFSKELKIIFEPLKIHIIGLARK